MNILDSLPKTSELTPFLNSINQGVDSPDLGVDVGGMKTDLLRNVSQAPEDGLTMPAVPDLPSRDGFLGSLDQPLNGLTAINGASLEKDLSGPLPIQLDPPDFDVNSVMGDITGAVVPVEPLPRNVQMSGFDAFDPEEFLGPLRRLGEAGAATPMRLLNMLLSILQSFIDTVTDPDKLIDLTVESLKEILDGQIQDLHYHIPVAAVDEVTTALDANFLDQYEELLNRIDALKGKSYAEVAPVLANAETIALPPLHALGKTATTLTHLSAPSTDDLTAALADVLEFALSQNVFLQPYFDTIEKKAGAVIDLINPPVERLREMAGKIKDYLDTAADKAEEAAQSLGGTLTSSIDKVNGFLNQANAKIIEVEQQIDGLVGQVDVSGPVTTVKDGINKVSTSIQAFFVKVEEVKQQLDDVVKQVQDQVDEKLQKAFDALKAKIEELLATITKVLEYPDVKKTLDEARQGVEDFKKIIDEASLKPIFDLVINKTSDLENSIKAIDVARLGTPQKTALKVGAKIIQEIKVDEIVKPELMAAFEQIQQPLLELIQLLKEKVLIVEQAIDEFNPGTLATDLILNSPGYQAVIGALESIKPSALLAPLKEANEALVGIVEKLDPQIIIDQVQRVYDQLYSLVEALSPAALIQIIAQATNTATFQLQQVHDFEVDRLINTIKKTISLEKLLEGLGLQDLAQADFWNMLNNVLGGGYLNLIKEAVDQVEQSLPAQVSSIDFSATMDQLQAVAAEVDAQIAVTTADFSKATKALQTLLDDGKDRALQLEARRQVMAAETAHYPETRQMLEAMVLTPYTDAATAAAALNALAGPTRSAALSDVKTILTDARPKLAGMAANTLQAGVPAIFKTQFGDPTRALITNLQVKLVDFIGTDQEPGVVAAIQDIVLTLGELPSKIDRTIGDNILEPLREGVKETLVNVIEAIETFRDALTGTLQAIYDKAKEIVEAFNPVWLLNMFAVSDFSPGGMGTLAGKIVSPGDDRLAALAQTHLTDAELDILRSASGTLTAGQRDNVLKALNNTLRDAKLAASGNAPSSYYDGVIGSLTAEKAALEAALETKDQEMARIQNLIKLYRTDAALQQLGGAWNAYQSAAVKDTPMIRLNRLIFEASYAEAIGMSLQSLHPFLLEQVANLYPEETVKRLDAIYATIIDTIKKMPDELIREPLDAAFNQVKKTLTDTFDIKGLFNVLEIKIDGMDEDLSEGLDRLSGGYNRLLTTLNQRLAS